MIIFNYKTAHLEPEDFVGGQIPADYKTPGAAFRQLTEEAHEKILDCQLVFIGKHCIKNRCGSISKKGRPLF